MIRVRYWELTEAEKDQLNALGERWARSLTDFLRRVFNIPRRS